MVCVLHCSPPPFSSLFPALVCRHAHCTPAHVDPIPGCTIVLAAFKHVQSDAVAALPSKLHMHAVHPFRACCSAGCSASQCLWVQLLLAKALHAAPAAAAHVCRALTFLCSWKHTHISPHHNAHAPQSLQVRHPWHCRQWHHCRSELQGCMQEQVVAGLRGGTTACSTGSMCMHCPRPPWQHEHGSLCLHCPQSVVGL